MYMYVDIRSKIKSPNSCTRRLHPFFENLSPLQDRIYNLVFCICALFPNYPNESNHTTSDQIGRILKLLQPDKVLLDAPRADEPIKDAHAARLVVRPASARAAERLLAHGGARAFFVVVHVAGCVAQDVCGADEGLA
jgi:hypothetical protein